MSNFALKEVVQVNGKIKFYKLSVNGNCQFDEFCEQIEQEGNFISDLRSAFSIMNSVSQMQLLPYNKFHELKDVKGKVKEYEIKKGSIRIYAIKDEAGFLIIIGAKKSSQNKDIKTFRNVKQTYLNSL